MADLTTDELVFAILRLTTFESDPLFALSTLGVVERIVAGEFDRYARRARRHGRSWDEIAAAIGIDTTIAVRRFAARADVPFDAGLGPTPQRPIDWPLSVELTR